MEHFLVNNGGTLLIESSRQGIRSMEEARVTKLGQQTEDVEITE